MLTIVTWLWESAGDRRYGVYKPEHVNALARMLKDTMACPYNLVCITNYQNLKVECDTYPLWEYKDLPVVRGCYHRLKLFDKEINKDFGEWIMSCDLDVVVEDDLGCLIDEEHDFQGIRGTSSYVNGSLWAFRRGTCEDILDLFLRHGGKKPPESKRNYGGTDQSIMSYAREGCKLWTEEEGVWTYKVMRRKSVSPEYRRFTAFPGGVKPWKNMESHFAFQQLHKRYMSYYQ